MTRLNFPVLITIVCVIVFGLCAAGCNEGTVRDASGTSGAAAANLPAGEQQAPMKNNDGKAPRLVFKELSHDFGKQTSGPDLTHSFTFKNEGDGTLIIEKVKAG